MQKPEIDQIIGVAIHGLGSSGEGVGGVDGYTVFVDGALPGEVVRARLTECHARYGKAKLLSILKPSPDRVVPPCPLFGRCGGCQIMHLSYEKQLEIKRQRVVDALHRIGHIDDCEVEPCLPSPSALHYRNKIQLPVRDGKIGLYARGSNDLVDVRKCYIHCALGEEIYERVRPLVEHLSGLRHLLFKTAVNAGEVLVVWVTSQPPTPELFALAKQILAAHPAIKGVVHNQHVGKENVILGKRYTVLAGVGFIYEQISGLTFKVSPASFFQVNPAQAELLYAKALEYADLKGDETVLDAYCGVGTLSLLFAKQAKKVIGVECVPEAIEDAKENARLNGIENCAFVCAASENYPMPQVDVVVLNPPRKGCDPKFLEKLSAQKFVYISCDPATLARDLALLRQRGYQIGSVQPFDMFPQTAHVECVVSGHSIDGGE